MREVDPRLVELNRRNKEFWERQRVLMEGRMADPAILQSAIETIASELTRHVPIRNQMPFEQALEERERDRMRFISALARAGGKADKTDPLQQLIVDIVRSNPLVSAQQLLEELKKRERGPIIQEVDKEEIHCCKSASRRSGQDEPVVTNERQASAPISGLKHRLTRARKKIRQHIQSR